MRMPSSPSPVVALLCSLLLHALVGLGGWYFFKTAGPAPMRLAAVVADTSERLNLSIVFESKPRARQADTPINTRIEEPLATDSNAELGEVPEFHPVEMAPRSVDSVAALPAVAPYGTDGGPSKPCSGQGASGNRGPGVRFCEVGAAARSVVYVIDCSLSMGRSGALRRAKLELLASLQQLPENAQCQVLAYDLAPHFLVGPEQLLPAQPETIAALVQGINSLAASGSTKHLPALRRALLLKPDVIYLVTDGGDLLGNDVQIASSLNQGHAIIHVIEMTSLPPQRDGPLAQLAGNNRGTYCCVKPAP